MKISKKGWDYWWEEWIKPVLIAAVLAFFIRAFIIQPFKIPSGSMFPTLKPGDRIFVSKFLYGARIPFTDIRLPKVRAPETGDIVVFLSTEKDTKKKFLIKRYIAGGGDMVNIHDGKIFINGIALEGKPFDGLFYYNQGKYAPETSVVHVPKDHFFVLGDNSGSSFDSRYWGFVPYSNMVGRAFMIHWPIKRMRLMKEGY